jgi:Recombination endonuclease VII
MKVCLKCHQTKPLEEFYRRKRSKDGRDWYCKPCGKANAQQWRKHNHEREREVCRQWRQRNKERFKFLQWRRDLKQMYGLSHEEWTAMLICQSGRCAICGVPFDERNHFSKASVDHDHATESVRELVHKNCNLLLGVANDDIELLEKAIAYLKRHRG